MSSVTVISDSVFATEVLQVEVPVLAYFWAPWCGPCRLVSPSLDGVAKFYGDRLKIVKLEVDPNQATVKQYNVEGVPAFRLFKDGIVIASLEGAITKEKLIKFIDSYL